MALIEDWWLTPDGAFKMSTSEHAQFAIATMLKMQVGERVPKYWLFKGVELPALKLAISRGADPEAVEFLNNKHSDARLFALKNYGWVRVAKNAFNFWAFDDRTADIIRRATDYWESQYSMSQHHEMIDVYEFKTNDQFAVNVSKLLAGGRPHVLKQLSMGHVEDVVIQEPLPVPEYAAAKFTELERDRLYRRTGDNPGEVYDASVDLDE